MHFSQEKVTKDSIQQSGLKYTVIFKNCLILYHGVLTSLLFSYAFFKDMQVNSYYFCVQSKSNSWTWDSMKYVQLNMARFISKIWTYRVPTNTIEWSSYLLESEGQTRICSNLLYENGDWHA